MQSSVHPGGGGDEPCPPSQSQQRVAVRSGGRWRAGLRRIGRDERGLTTVEYVIALCLVGAVAVGLWGKFGGMLRTRVGQATTLIGDSTRLQSSKADGAD